MNKFLKSIKLSNLYIFALIAIGVLCGLDTTAMTADSVAVPAGPDQQGPGVVQTDQISTYQNTNETVDDLNLPEIDRKVVKIRPMGNPLETISRYSETRKSDSMVVKYYATSVLAVKTSVKEAYVKDDSSRINLNTKNNGIFSNQEIILFPSVQGYDSRGVKSMSIFQAYVVAIDKNGLDLIPCNGPIVADKVVFPDIPADAVVLRTAKALNEKELKTSPFNQLPTSKEQYLQKFSCMVEQTTLEKRSPKEADWTISDIAEEALFDMKRGMNKNYMIGAKSLFYNEKGDAIYSTGGIWWMANKTFLYGDGTTDQLTFHDLIDLSKFVFTGSAGNKSKIFLMGSDLLANMSKIQYLDNYKPADTTFIRFGITFKEISTNFGTFWTVHDESFDDALMSDKGFILDGDYLKKYIFQALSVRKADLRKNLEKDTDAETWLEISGLVLQNGDAHCRVEKKS